jgi:hypothetical protein
MIETGSQLLKRGGVYLVEKGVAEWEMVFEEATR